MKTIWLVCLLAFATATFGAPDLYIKDTPVDSGVEPNPDAGPMWVSEDIWVRQDPFPGYQPFPFVADPPWLTAVSPLHQNGEYRDPKSSRPNYLYVRVRNRGSTASTGAERLRVYWAKASTGLAWPAHWVDYVAAHCGPNRLYGIEITKPRRNAADPGVSAADLNEYRDAIIAAGTIATYQFPDGVSYFDKQDAIHEHVSTTATFAHMSDGFLPWHREFISRYEILLREAYPKVTLFYWDWRTDPRLYPALTGLLGSFSGSIGAPFNVLAPPSVTRQTGTDSWAPSPTATLDSTITGQTTYGLTRSQNENSHNRSHVFIGGTTGNMSDTGTAAEDPIFFMLHANADRLWSMWQRKNTNRLDPALTYTGTSTDMTQPMSPWNGLTYNGSVASVSNPSLGMSPWTTADGYIYNKAANDPSVVFPPIYDTSPLVIPVLQAGESVVIQIPWYPPNPANFACFGADQGHVCLLARIETSTTSPFGMTTLEGADVNLNTKNNNNIAWKNVTVQDTFPGPLFLVDIFVRNILPDREMFAIFNFTIPLAERNENLYNFGNLYVDLGPVLYQRWIEGGAMGQGIERLPNNRLQLFSPDAQIRNLKLLPDEVHRVQTTFQLRKDYTHPRGKAYHLDLVQYADNIGAVPRLVGGNRHQFNFNKLTLVPEGAQWLYLDSGALDSDRWREVDYDDKAWEVGPAELGYEDDPATTVDSGHITTWFRHRFDLADPSLYQNLILRLKADDGAVVYLNGTEIYRRGMPSGPVAPDTLAVQSVEGVWEDLFVIANVSNFLPLLQTGANILAVELHQDSTTPTDASFDLELCANLLTPRFPPIVRVPFPPNQPTHLAGDPVRLTAEGADGDGKVRSLSFYVKGELIGIVNDEQGSIIWSNAPVGNHRMEVVASDDDGLTGSGYATISVLRNLPPEVRIVDPPHGAVFNTTDSILITAEAFDHGGDIDMVEFFKRYGHGFSAEEEFIGSAFMPPYMVGVRNLPPGQHTFTAYAYDDQGEITGSRPISIQIVDNTDPRRLRLVRMQNHLMLYWSSSEAILEHVDRLDGQWKPLPNARSPHMIFPDDKAKFYRLHLPD